MLLPADFCLFWWHKSPCRFAGVTPSMLSTLFTKGAVGPHSRPDELFVSVRFYGWASF